jgi:hypothetical protein
MCAFYSFLCLTLDGSEWSVSRPGHVLPSGKGPAYPMVKVLGGPQRASLVTKVRRRIFGPAQDQTLVFQSVVRYYTDCATLAT